MSTTETESIPAPKPATEPSLEELAANLQEVARRIEAAVAQRDQSGDESLRHPVRLVAVSKTKSTDCMRRAYECGARIFGENYVQEIVDKAPQMPPDVQWHFIGHLQSNKARELVHGVPNLTVIETIDSAKLAGKVDAAVASSTRADKPLDVFIQVNTSGEESKSGVSPDDGEAAAIAEHIAKNCPRLRVRGLMTIGMPDYTSRPENFECLRRVREDVAKKLGVSTNVLELSMGMSADYELAIIGGATNVRVGSTIFGQRAKRPPSPRKDQ
jgi:pyridoxal phosphate enzyme (YggS family)